MSDNKKPSNDFIGKIKYLNTLPEIEVDPRLVIIQNDLKQYSEYKLSIAEKTFKYNIPINIRSQIGLDLVELQKYTETRQNQEESINIVAANSSRQEEEKDEITSEIESAKVPESDSFAESTFSFFDNRDWREIIENQNPVGIKIKRVIPIFPTKHERVTELMVFDCDPDPPKTDSGESKCVDGFLKTEKHKNPTSYYYFSNKSKEDINESHEIYKFSREFQQTKRHADIQKNLIFVLKDDQIFYYKVKSRTHLKKLSKLESRNKEQHKPLLVTK